MPTAPSTDELRTDHFPAVLVRRGEDLADLDRRLQACLLIARQVAPGRAGADVAGVTSSPCRATP